MKLLVAIDMSGLTLATLRKLSRESFLSEVLCFGQHIAKKHEGEYPFSLFIASATASHPAFYPAASRFPQTMANRSYVLLEQVILLKSDNA